MRYVDHCQDIYMVFPTISPPFGRADNWSVGHGSWVKWVNKSGWVMCVTCDPLTRDPLTDDEVNQISRTISLTFGVRPIKRDFLLR